MAVPESFLAEVSAAVTAGTVVLRDESLAKRTTLRVGGPADLYLEPASEEELARVLQLAATHRVPMTFLGRGSNLLIRDGGIRGAVICLAHPVFSRVDAIEQRLHCGAGARLKAVAVAARRHALSGLEFLEGIPGSVGGALRMNAGAMGSSLFDVVERVRVMDRAGGVTERPASELSVTYRCCPLFHDHLALGAVLQGRPAPQDEIAERMSRFSGKRWSSQPAAPSAGCIFKNPATIPAGKLIQELGLKGTRVGGALVSEVHGNFIVTDGTATARDVLTLIRQIQEKARAERGIELETEVQVLGEG